MVFKIHSIYRCNILYHCCIMAIIICIVVEVLKKITSPEFIQCNFIGIYKPCAFVNLRILSPFILIECILRCKNPIHRILNRIFSTSHSKLLTIISDLFIGCLQYKILKQSIILFFIFITCTLGAKDTFTTFSFSENKNTVLLFEKKIKIHDRDLSNAIQNKFLYQIGKNYSLFGALISGREETYEFMFKYFLNASQVSHCTKSKLNEIRVTNQLHTHPVRTDKNILTLKHSKTAHPSEKHLLKSAKKNKKKVLSSEVEVTVNTQELICKNLNQFNLITMGSESVVIPDSVSNKIVQSKVLIDIAKIYSDNGNYSKALDYLLESYELSKTFNTKMLILISSIEIVNIYLLVEDNDKAKEYLEECNKMIRKLQLENFPNIELFGNQKNNAPINSNANPYEKIINDMFSPENIGSKNLFSKNTGSFPKQEGVESILKKSEVEEVKLGKIWIIYMMVVLTMILLLLIFIFFQYKKLTLKYKNIEVKNHEIDIQDKKLKSKKDDNTLRKYTSSSLNDAKKNEILTRLNKLLDVEKIYLQSNISIVDISQKIGVSRTYISQIINEKFNESFTNLINRYRIEEAIKLISCCENNIYSIAGIAQNTGFTSISSFNRYFKIHTGLTPSMYRHNVQKQFITDNYTTTIFSTDAGEL